MNVAKALLYWIWSMKLYILGSLSNEDHDSIDIVAENV